MADSLGPATPKITMTLLIEECHKVCTNIEDETTKFAAAAGKISGWTVLIPEAPPSTPMQSPSLLSDLSMLRARLMRVSNDLNSINSDLADNL